MFEKVGSIQYWVNDQEEDGQEIVQRLAPRSAAMMTSAVVAGIMALAAQNVFSHLSAPWTIGLYVGLFLAFLFPLHAVARWLLARKLGKLERKGVVVRTDNNAFLLLANRLDTPLDEVRVEERQVLWPLVSAYLHRVYPGVMLLGDGSVTDADSGELQQSVAACASQTAELFKETLAKLREVGKLVRSYKSDVERLRREMADGARDAQSQGRIAADVERALG